MTADESQLPSLGKLRFPNASSFARRSFSLRRALDNMLPDLYYTIVKFIISDMFYSKE